MRNDKTIDTLNKLLEINNDRLEGYETALNETGEHDIKTLFAQLARTSHRNRKELAFEILNLGGKPTDKTAKGGTLFRLWMDMKATLTGMDRVAVISSCETEEDKTLEVYQDVLNNEIGNMNTNQKAMIQAQFELLKDDHDLIHSLLDALSSSTDKTGNQSNEY